MRRFSRKLSDTALDVLGILSIIGLLFIIGYTINEEQEARRQAENYELLYASTSSSTNTTTTTTIRDTKPLVFNYDFCYIAYSRINGVKHWYNTAEGYEAYAKKGFTAIKGDVRITSDGKLIMCHDAGFTFNDAGKITNYNNSNAVNIRDLTEEECLALQYASGNTHVCTFERFMEICKNHDVIAYITIRDEYISEMIPEMMSILREYDMVEKCVINSFTYSTLQAVRSVDSSIALSHVMPYKAKIEKDAIDRAAALGNCIVTGFNFSANSTTADVATAIDPHVMEYAKDKGVPIHEAQVHSIEMVNTLKEYGVSGAQMMIYPHVE